MVVWGNRARSFQCRAEMGQNKAGKPSSWAPGRDSSPKGDGAGRQCKLLEMRMVKGCRGPAF